MRGKEIVNLPIPATGFRRVSGKGRRGCRGMDSSHHYHLARRSQSSRLVPIGKNPSQSSKRFGRRVPINDDPQNIKGSKNYHLVMTNSSPWKITML
jgi:hypothetical protein